MKSILSLILLFGCVGHYFSQADIHCTYADKFYLQGFNGELEVDFEIKEDFLEVKTIYNCYFYKIFIPNITSVEIYENNSKFYIGFVVKTKTDIYRKCERSLGGSIDDKTLIGGPIISNLDEVNELPNYFSELFKELGF